MQKEIQIKKGDQYSHRGWLQSDSFVKRALAVYLYALMGGFLFGLFFLLIMFGVTLFTGVALSTILF